jgi:DNA polymerase-3 subunit chi
MEIWFYHLHRQPPEQALPGLLERSLARGWRAAVQARTSARIETIDAHLWTYSDASFLAHGTKADGDPEWQPIYLTTGAENANGATLRIFVEQAPILPSVQAAPAAYQRCILLFDGDDPEQLADARAQWRALRAEGHDLTYYQQTDTGGWTKKS